ncbi:ornithine cyclodeaminase [Advenella kashmirensis W13003]|uniref:Ornithine cyclodeaminase n=1 Tax=Advenella kashmirensis W13003 TaxID=1424334 RepID=V8R013_9BURK|nr:delta(1)-pyrroline-2-carboxylate reductase family protein [Advenella kashmirensis]ETF04589.1 ornithine cyclodeaminase [Advenella kashmirensis W13003]
MSSSTVRVFNVEETRQLIAFAPLRQYILDAALEYAQGKIESPDRQVLKVPDSKEGVLLSMPCTASDICAHKLISLLPANPDQGRPTIQGVVSVIDSATGVPLFVLDGPTVTARRTAALSMAGLQLFLEKDPRSIVIIGAGTQAEGHVQAIAELYPGATVYIAGRPESYAKAQAFCERHADLDIRLEVTDLNQLPEQFDAVITLTTAVEPVYHAPPVAGRLIIGVGAFRSHMVEIAPETVMNSVCYVDDLVGAQHEAGDYIQAKKDWNEVTTLAQAIEGDIDYSRPIMFKTVGCAAWDLAAARCARAAAGL